MSQIPRRTFRPLAALAVIAGLLLPASSSAQTADATLLGTWTAPAGGAVSQAMIGGVSTATYSMKIYASCSPVPCDWGTSPLTIYANSPATKVGKIGVATFDQSIASRVVVVTALDTTPPTLRLDVYTHFKAGDKRSNYVSTQTLHH